MRTVSDFAVRLLLPICLLAPCGAARGGEIDPPGKKIMEDWDAGNYLRDEIVEGETQVYKRFTIMGKSKTIDEKRRTTSWSLRYGKNNQATVMRYHTPKDLENLTVLSYRDTTLGNKPYLVWQWEPDKKPPLLKQVSGPTSMENKTDYFAQTDFTFEDLEPEDLDAYVYLHVRDEKVDNADCYVVEAYAKPEHGKTGYARRVLWITKDRKLMVQVQLYNLNNRLDKTFTASNFVEALPGVWRANTAMMKKENQETWTKMVTTKRRAQPGIPPWFFSTNVIKVTDPKGMKLIEEMWDIWNQTQKARKELEDAKAELEALRKAKDGGK